MTAAVRMDDVQWPKALNHVITKRWSQLKNTLVMKDFVDHLIQRRVVTLDYWMGLKSKTVSESERTEDFLSLVLKFDQQKFNHFLEALLVIDRQDLVRQLMKCQDVKQTSGKYQRSNSKSSSTKSTRSSKSALNVGGTDIVTGTTDCDQLPSDVGPPRFVGNKVNSTSKTDGHNGSQEFNKAKKGMDGNTNKAPVSPDKKIDRKRPVNGEVANTDSPNNLNAVAKETRITTEGRADKDHTVNVDKKPTASKATANATKKNDVSKPEDPKKMTRKIADIPGVNLKDQESSEKEISSRKDELQRKEEQLQSKETELREKELKLKEQEKILNQKETELLTRENSLLSNYTGQSVIGPLVNRFDDNSNPPSATTTQSTDIFSEVREQLAAIKKEQEIESEHTTRTGFNKDDFVKVGEFQAVQQEVEGLKEEMVSERSCRENLHKKVEDLKHEIENLNSTIKALEIEKQSDRSVLDKEINRIKTELKNAKLCYNDAIAKIKSDLKNKENECEKLKAILGQIKQDHDHLDKRVEILEKEKQKFELEVLRYERELSELKNVLDGKETQLLDLRKALEDTENEKEDLVDEVSDLKTEVARLKDVRKRLEQEKKTLIGRCVKPNWNGSTTRRPSIR